MINWYNEVSRNLNKIPDCTIYFDKELQEAKKQCRIYGNLERASAALPGIVEERFGQLQQLEAILEYLNIELRRLRAKTFKKFLNEASGFPTGPVGENPNNLAGEVTDTLGSDVFNPQNLKRINAIIGAISNME